MTLEELEVTWSSIRPPMGTDAISGRRATGMLHECVVYLAVDGKGDRHFLIRVPDNTKPVIFRGTRGLVVNTTRYQVGSNPEALYLDLACDDSAQNLTFNAVAQDLLRSLREANGPLRDVVVDGLARWRSFWSVESDSLSMEDALGLFGELWFLRRWLAPVNDDTIARWQATKGARHDFQWASASVEIKTTAGLAGTDPIHAISGLEQLADPEQGQLYLFSLHVHDDTLAGNTLHSLVQGLTTELAGNFSALEVLNEKLAMRGYRPVESPASTRSLRILSERLYRVSEGFPRITADSFESGLPPGIANIRYSVDLAACYPWLVATSPIDLYDL